MKIFYLIVRDVILLLLISWAIYVTTHKDEIVGMAVAEYIENHDLIQIWSTNS